MNIGSASLSIGANVSGLQSGLQSAMASVQSYAQGTRASLAAATGGWSEVFLSIKSVITILTSGALVNHFNEIAESIDKTKDQAEAFGTSFAFVQSLQSAGIDNAGKSLKKLSTQLDSLATGAASARREFRLIGLEAKDLQGLSTEKAFEKTLEAIGKMPPGIERTTVGTKLLGKEFTTLLEKFGSGSGALQEMRDKAEAMGTALTGIQVGNVKEMVDTWREVKQSIKGVWMQITAALAPAFSAIYTIVSRVIQIFRNLIQPILTVAGAIFSLVNLVLKPFIMVIDTIILVASKLNKVLSALNPFNWFGKAEVDEKRAGLAALGADIKAEKDKLDKSFRDFGKTQQEIMLLELRLRPDAAGNAEAQRMIDGLQRAADRNMSQAITASVDPTIKMNEELERLERLYRTGALSAQNFALAQNRVLTQAERAVGLGRVMRAEANIEKGSAKAFEIITNWQLNAKAQDRTPEERMIAIENAHLNVAEQMLERLNRIAGRRPDPPIL